MPRARTMVTAASESGIRIWNISRMDPAYALAAPLASRRSRRLRRGLWAPDHRPKVARLPGERAMVILHHLNNSRSQRILWLLEELGAPYEIKRYQRDAVTNLAPPALKAVHPLGKSPVIEDGEI